MTRCLALLQEGGVLEVEVPYEKALTAWQDPTHIRAMNENSWLYYTQWFWYLGWFEHRFEIDSSCYLDAQLQPCSHERAAFMRLALKKIPTTPHERTIARTMQANWIAPDDEAPYTPRAAAAFSSTEHQSNSNVAAPPPLNASSL